MFWKLTFLSIFTDTFSILSISLSILKGFRSRRCSITPSLLKSETANGRPCKSYVEFVLAKDYRDTFPELSSSSWIVHWCRQREPENPNIPPHSTTCGFFPWAAVSSEQLHFSVMKKNDLKATWSVLSPFKKNLTWFIVPQMAGTLLCLRSLKSWYRHPALIKAWGTW